MPRLIIPTTLPFVTVPAFKAHPTFLDLNNLRSGDPTAGDQDIELNNILLMSSNWAAGYVGMPLHAHTNTEQMRMRADRRGRLLIHAADTPVRSVSSLAWGFTPGQLNTYANPTVWIEYDETIVYDVRGASWSWGPGALQIGTPSPSADLYVQMTYAAGYVNALLVGNPAGGANTLQLTDVTGVRPGAILRIWEPGKEEAVQVSAAYVPGTNPVALTTNTVNAHTAGAGVSELSPDTHEAVILYGTAMLTHPDRQAEDEWPDSDSGPSTRQSDARQTGAGLVAEAKRLLQRMRDQR